MPRSARKIELPVISKAADARRIKTLIAGVEKSYGATHGHVHEAAMAILRHSAPVANGGLGYGDCTLAAALARAVPKRERNSLIGWFILVSPIGILLDNKQPSKDNARFVKEGAKVPTEATYDDDDGRFQKGDIIAVPLKERDYVWDLAKAGKLNWWDDPARVNPVPSDLVTYDGFFSTILSAIDKEIKAAQATLDHSMLRQGQKPRYDEGQAAEVIKAAKTLKTSILDFKASKAAAISASQSVANEEGETKTVRRGRPRAVSAGGEQMAA